MVDDLFICHAGRDKADVVEPLVVALRKRGRRVWLDQMEILIGDSLTQKIDEGLAHARLGVVVVSQAVLPKETGWVRRELNALATREAQEGRVVVLPVWHQVTFEKVAEYSLTLAAKLAANTQDGISSVADMIKRRCLLERSEASAKVEGASAKSGVVRLRPNTQVLMGNRGQVSVDPLRGSRRGTYPLDDSKMRAGIGNHNSSLSTSLPVEHTTNSTTGALGESHREHAAPQQAPSTEAKRHLRHVQRIMERSISEYRPQCQPGDVAAQRAIPYRRQYGALDSLRRFAAKSSTSEVVEQLVAFRIEGQGDYADMLTSLVANREPNDLIKLLVEMPDSKLIAGDRETLLRMISLLPPTSLAAGIAQLRSKGCTKDARRLLDLAATRSDPLEVAEALRGFQQTSGDVRGFLKAAGRGGLEL